MKSKTFIHALMLLAVFLINASPEIAFAYPGLQTNDVAQPVVAIHVSEITNAMETTPARSPTPSGYGTSGYQWWYTSWHYYTIYQALEEALQSDGTPYVEVTDADIASGALLLSDGTPRYPIVFSLASEAINNNEVAPLRSYVNAGGTLFVGSSAFTRNPDGTARGNFALSSEMGVRMASSSLDNWIESRDFIKVMDHRLIAHVPSGVLSWLMAWAKGVYVPGANYMWHVQNIDAQVLANVASDPLLTTKNYGQGRFIYHAAFQPLIGHGGDSSDTYAYVIYRRAIEWAFEEMGMPLVKRSPWPYPYNAAMIVRHDFENWASEIVQIESSANYEHSAGAKGDYYFTTGTLRAGSPDNQLSEAQKAAAVESLRRAVSQYGATIGSHNGGLKNPNGSYAPTNEVYYHWGPDTVLDSIIPGYTNGREYAKSSIQISFQDIAGWLAGLDNGRAGCGATNSCPRTFVSPNFHATLEPSREILQELGSINMGEQNIGPFPTHVISYNVKGKTFPAVTLPTSEWYVESVVAQSLEFGGPLPGHNNSTLHAAVDFYYDLGALVNVYGHHAALTGVYQEYVRYASAKPNIWSTNTVGIVDWWALRSPVVVQPSFSHSGDTLIATAQVSGATDPNTAVEIIIPKWNPTESEIQVLFNDSPASPSDYRQTSTGVKVRVGTTVSKVEVRVVQMQSWTQTDWVGGAGQATWSDATRFDSASGVDTSTAGLIRLSTEGAAPTIFSDDFNRTGLGSWTLRSGNGTVTNNQFQNSAAADYYGYAYYAPTPEWTDYSVETKIRFSAGTYGGGLGGRLDSSNGAHYAAWVYPGTNILRLVKFTAWEGWSGASMDQVTLPTVGTATHTLRLEFKQNRILVYWDGSQVVDVIDSNYEQRSPYLSGGISLDMYANASSDRVYYDDLVVKGFPGYRTLGTLNSSAFDGGANAAWKKMSMSGTVPVNTGLCTRVRAANQLEDLPAVSWSACYANSGDIATTFGRWFQYQVTLTSSDTGATPVLDGISFGYDHSNTVVVVAQNDAYTIDEDHTLSEPGPGVLGNDSGPSGVTLSAALVSGPAHGTLDLQSDGEFTYTPATNYNGSDTFTYRATAGTTQSNMATVTITVAPVNDAPAAADDAYTTNEDTTLNVVVPGVLSNDSDLDGQSLTVAVETSPHHGTLTLNANGSFTYVPAANYTGMDSFGYRASDGVLSDSAQVNITINPVNDPPIGEPDGYTTHEDTPLNVASPGVLTNDTDQEGSPLTAQLVTQPAHGTLTFNADGSFSYTPAVNYNGADGFTYRPHDGTVVGNPTMVTINVSPVNDPPVGAQDAYTLDVDTVLNVTVPGVLTNDTDVDNTSLSADLVSQPTHGTLTLNANGSFTYTPASGYVGTDAFSYRPFDGQQYGGATMVSLTVNPINHLPVAAADAYSTDEDVALNVASPGVLVNDTDVDGQTLTAELVATTSHGTLTLNANGSFTYTPAANYNGADSFTYRPYDGIGRGNIVTVSLTVSPVNDLPVGSPDSYSTNEDTTLNVAAPGVLGNDTDADGQALSAALVASTTHGTLALNANGSFAYTPTANFNGSDSFTYQPSDGVARGATVTVSLTVNAVNDLPAGNPDSYSTDEDTALNVAAPGVLTNDSDVENSSLSAVLAAGPAHGSLMLNANGSFVYTPAANYNGADSFTYRPSDGVGQGNVTTVSLTVNPVNDAPTAQADHYSTNRNTLLSVAAPGVLSNDSDVENSPLHAVVAAAPAHGSLTLNTDGSFQYLPETGYTGSDAFTYTAGDGSLVSAPATVTIDVVFTNTPPTANPDALAVDEDVTVEAVAPGVLGNDSDPDGQTLTAVLATGPAHGTLTLNANGAFTYTPAANYNGSDSFTYRASDGLATSSPATVSITINPVNDSPVAVDDSYSTPIGTALQAGAPGVLTNDTDIDGPGLTAAVVSQPAHGSLTLNANGSFTYTPNAGFVGNDSFTYQASDGSLTSQAAVVTIAVMPVTQLFSDDFTRPAQPPQVPFSWTIPTTSLTYPNRGVFSTLNGVLTTSTSVAEEYGFAYPPSPTITDHSVEADLRFPQSGIYGGGIFGRLTSYGRRYGAWVYPEGSSGIPSEFDHNRAVVKLVKFYNWGDFTYPLGMQTVSVPAVGTGWHHVKMSFSGTRIRVYFDNMTTPVVDMSDSNFGGLSAYASGRVGVDLYATANRLGPTFNNFVVRDSAGTEVFRDNFGEDPFDPLLPWISHSGTWSVSNGAMTGSATASQYGMVYTPAQPNWTDFRVDGLMQLPAGSYGGALVGRLNTTSGAHYAAWVYPDGSAAGSNLLRLYKYTGWTTRIETPLAEATLPSVGAGQHRIEMMLIGNHIQVFFDGVLAADVVDNGAGSVPAYTTGGIAWAVYSDGGVDQVAVDDVLVESLVP